MRDRMERFVILPLPFGCVSEASVVVGISHHPRSSTSDTNSPPADATNGLKGDRDTTAESLSGDESMRNLLGFHEDVPKSNTFLSFNRLFKGFKNLPQLFVDKEEELEEVELDMEIGCPTNVQHVTHIGWDGFAGTEVAMSSNSIRGRETNLIPPQSLLSLPLQHYEPSSLEPKSGTS